MPLFHATILTLFPDIFPGSLSYSLAGQALKKNVWSYETINIRDFGKTKHKKVDDEAFGGGDGLIMRPDVIGDAISYALEKYPGSVIYAPSPKGTVFSQKIAKEVILSQNIIIICGRFEGIDQRVIEEYGVIEVSIGDYILSGGELAVQVMLDCCVRLLPGVLKNQATIAAESFEIDGEFSGMLECPQYTRPANWKSREVPSILLSGHHENIKQWRRDKSIEITKARRPDLLQKII